MPLPRPMLKEVISHNEGSDLADWSGCAGVGRATSAQDVLAVRWFFANRWERLPLILVDMLPGLLIRRRIGKVADLQPLYGQVAFRFYLSERGRKDRIPLQRCQGVR